MLHGLTLLGCSLLPSQARAHLPPDSSTLYLDVNQRERTCATHGSSKGHICVWGSDRVKGW